MNKNDILNRIRQEAVEHEDAHPSVNGHDQAVIQNMLREINAGGEYDRPFRNVQELIDHYIRGAGPIVARYIRELNSQLTRSELLHHLLGNRGSRCPRVKNCAEILWNLWQDFLSSDEFLDTRVFHGFDAAFVSLKMKEYTAELIGLSQNPYVFNQMTGTMQMVAGFGEPGFREILMDYFMHPQRIQEYLTSDAVMQKFHPDEERIRRELDWWKHSGRYTAFVGLKHYPSAQTVEMLTKYAEEVEEEKEMKLQQCKDRYERADIRYEYSTLLKAIRDTVSHMQKCLDGAVKAENSPVHEEK